MENAIAVIAATTSLMLFTSYSVLMRGLKLESYKDRLVMVRERWFDLAIDEESSLKFDSPEYRSLVDLVEDLMDFADALSVFSLFWLWATKKLGKETKKIDSTMEWENIHDPYTREKVRGVWWLLNWSISSYLRSLSVGYALWTDLARLLSEQPERSTDLEIQRLIPVPPGVPPHAALRI